MATRVVVDCLVSGASGDFPQRMGGRSRIAVLPGESRSQNYRENEA